MRAPLTLLHGHPVISLEDGPWLLDTGSPASFGVGPVRFGPVSGNPDRSHMGLDADRLSGLVGAPLRGLIGLDLIGASDLLMDLPAGQITITDRADPPDGALVPITRVMGVPVIAAETALGSHRAFLDTGAQLSYLQADGTEQFAEAGVVQDFFPLIGPFQTATRFVPFRIGPVGLTLRCGRLPGLLGMTLDLVGVDAVIGAELLTDRQIALLFSRDRLVLGDAG